MRKISQYVAGLAAYARSGAFPAAFFSILLALAVYGSVYQVGLAADSESGVSQEETVQGEKLNASQPESKAASGAYFPVYVIEGGEKSKALVRGGTVADVLGQVEIVLSKYDIVDIPLDTEVIEGDTITVTRIRYNTVEKRKKLPFETIARYSAEINPGNEKVLVEGESGIQIQTIRQTLVDGVVAEEAVKNFTVEREPVNREVLRGFPVKPVSSYDFDFAFDENCEPVGYTNVLRDQKSAGYSARAGASTASGMDAVVGNVAVNPNVIPYGTRLFIKSSDGDYIYGYAIAADTGIALMDGRITVDLFYGSYKESALHGIMDVDIFILD